MSGLYRSIGQYAILMRMAFSRPERGKVYWRLIIAETYKLGVQSLGIVALLSLFMGAVVTLQTAAN
ncbi:MAG: ABC transporter permease, partial [Flavobacteriales bacterium]